jgi:hypothetical protein
VRLAVRSYSLDTGEENVVSERRRLLPFSGWSSGKSQREFIYRPTGEISRPVNFTNKEPAISAVNLQGIEYTRSENHPRWRDFESGIGDRGGEFTNRKKYVIGDTTPVHVTTDWMTWGAGFDYRVIWDGPLTISPGIPGDLRSASAIESDDVSLDAWGAKAIALCAPTRPSVNLASALLELYRDGLPKLIGKELWQDRTLKAAASEHLNAQFGVAPLLSDVSDFVRTVIDMDKKLLQFVRDNGKVVRRRYSFPPDITVEDTVVDSNAVLYGPQQEPAIFGDFNVVPKPQVVRHREVTVNRWFSGAFVYHIPQTIVQAIYSPFADKWQEMRILLGTDLSANVLWQIAPWSWAVDWFTNAGDVINNADMWASDGLVMKYGYIMEHKVQRDTYTYVGSTRISSLDRVGWRPSQLQVVLETKRRRKANPFGFGLTYDGLSAIQKSILAALAASRGSWRF